jgi:hypothetical protein
MIQGVLNMRDDRWLWSRLKKGQVGRVGEHLVKVELMLHGFEIYVPEIDNGIDLLAKKNGEPPINVQVKTVRGYQYVFARKSSFALSDDLYMALMLLTDGQPPDFYLIPSLTWAKIEISSVFVSRDYEGLKSKPEWGLCLSAKNMPALAPYGAAEVLAKIGQSKQ